MSIKKLLIAFILLFIISWPTFSDARSGCCSYHGGVCGCECCDGSSLSSTCAPYYPECNDDSDDEYFVPATRIKIPPTNPISNSNAKLEYIVSKTGDNTFSVNFDWYYSNETDDKEWSVRLSKKSEDPGPLVDTNRSKIVFSDIKPGTYVLSLKSKVLGEWSGVSYWENIYVSEAMAKDKNPTSVNYTSQIPSPEPPQNNDDFEIFVFLLFLGSAFVNIILFISTIVFYRKSNKNLTP